MKIQILTGNESIDFKPSSFELFGFLLHNIYSVIQMERTSKNSNKLVLQPFGYSKVESMSRFPSKPV